MALWLVRAGRSGEYEAKFLADNRIYLTWERLSDDLSKLKTKQDLHKLLESLYPDDKPQSIRNYTGQLWQAAKEMKIGDWVVLPSKKKASIHIGEIKGDYVNDPKADDPFYHYRPVKWFAQDIPRSNFDQDILYSLGAFMTICRISRNDAEERIRSMAKNNWKSQTGGKVIRPPKEGTEYVDIERISRDQVAKYIERKYKGHEMAVLIEAILKAEGYFTYRSPEGPDKGIDLLAGIGPLGFDNPRLCVQVKTGDTPVDRPTLNQLIGAMQNVGAEQGLLISWSGFKSTVDKEVSTQFFRVRFWDQDAIIEALFKNYDRIDEEIKGELPLKKVWVLTIGEES